MGGVIVLLIFEAKHQQFKNIFMKMKKWSSQWTQFMQLRKEAWKKNSWLNFFFQASLHSCINCVHCNDHFFIFISFPQFIYDLFHISLSLKISLVNIWICHIYVFFGLKLHETADFVSDLGAYKFKEESLPFGLFVIEVNDLF